MRNSFQRVTVGAVSREPCAQLDELKRLSAAPIRSWRQPWSDGPPSMHGYCRWLRIPATPAIPMSATPTRPCGGIVISAGERHALPSCVHAAILPVWR